eukprot:gene12781-14996_t
MEFNGQLKVLLHKNLLLKKKSKIGICCEIVFPLVIVSILFMILGIIQSFEPDYDLTKLDKLTRYIKSDEVLLYGPTPLTKDQFDVMDLLMARFANDSSLPRNQTDTYFMSFADVASIDKYYANHSADVFAGIWFDSKTAPAANSTPFSYSIRMDSASIPATDKTYDRDTDALEYTKSGFASLQAAMDLAILSFYGANTTASPSASATQRYPNPYTSTWQSWNDGRDGIYKNAGGVFVTAALFMFAFRLITDIVIEKETKIKEGMKMMGMNDLAYFLSWNITSCIIGIPVAVTILIILKATGIIYHTGWASLFFLFIFYFFSLILIGFICSIFFNHSKFAGILSYLFILGLSICGIFVAKGDFSKFAKLLASLLSPVAYACASYTMAVEDLIDVMTANDKYLVTANDAIGEYGTSKPWYFCFQMSYWKPEKAVPSSADDLETMGSNEDIELIPMDIRTKVTVSIRNLRKEFNTGNGLRVAVNDLCLDMYQDQIHAFLGHNGAGKSTTIGMLTGLIPSTGGDALVQGYSIRNQMNKVRRTLGVCPQHDILWNNLTVHEHLTIYAALKGVTGKNIAIEATRFATEVGLAEKINAPSSTLSGGQKRKLCLAIAFIGRSEVIFLDEVTSGMDPLSRRGVWDFLLKYKQGRTIILTTHFMDEADFLGDRIAIISHGSLRCDGSSLFLKKKFGIGYLLTLAKQGACDSNQVTRFVQSHIPEAVVLSDAGTELSLRLPTSAVDLFATFFRDLDTNKSSMGIGNYGISVTTMEEVFLRIGQETSSTNFNLNSNANHDAAAVKAAISTSSTGTTAQQQLRGLLAKRIFTAMKDLKAFFLSILVPAVIIAGSIVIYKEIAPDGTFFNNGTTPLTFSMSDYGTSNIVPVAPPSSLISLSSSPYFSQLHGVSTNLEDYLEHTFKNQAGALNFSVPQSDYTIFYNRGYLHATPTHMNLVDDAILRSHNSIGINTTVAPFVHVMSAIELATTTINMNAVIYFTMLFMAGYSLMPASFAGNMCAERVFNIKRLLYISGCKKYIYWISNLVWDYTQALILIIIVSCTLAGVEPHFRKQFGIIFLAQILYALASIPVSYLFSYKYTTHGRATGAIFGIHYGIGIVMLIASINLRIQVVINQSTGVQLAADIIDYCFYAVSPVYALGRIMIMVLEFPGTMRLGQYEILDFWVVKVCGAPLLFLVGHAILWNAWIILVDYLPEIKGFLRNPKNVVAPSPPADEDSDVTAERERLAHGNSDEVLVMRGLHKLFPKKGKNPAKNAVYNTTLGIPRGQTFGLLGMNGAGKTTTLSMLAGDIVPTSGAASINGHDLITARSKALHSIGSCPQFDALVPLLTGREQLTLYARIKGVPEHQISETVEAFISMMDLTGIANSNVGGYSGGNKRKLSLSIAMLGNPSVVFLDEPSTGCDPQVRRFMWNVISELGRNKVIIITTHSMEECEALCQRISIMKDGQFTCLGSNQHVKSKFGSGYSIDIKFKKEHLENGVDIVCRTFPGITLLDRHDLIANFELANSDSSHPIQVSAIFDTIQQNLMEILDDYSVSQTSLEQVFLKLTASNHETRIAQVSENYIDPALLDE